LYTASVYEKITEKTLTSALAPHNFVKEYLTKNQGERLAAGTALGLLNK